MAAANPAGNQQAALIPYPYNLAFQSERDLTLALQNPATAEMVSAYTERYQTINVAHAMSHLSQVGNLFAIANAASKNFRSNIVVIEIMGKYQTLLKNSSVTAGSFVGQSLQALQAYKIAHTLATKGQFEQSVAMVKKCEVFAGRMVAQSGALVDQSQELCTLSQKALIQATEDQVGTAEQRKAIQQSMANYAAQQAKLSQLTKDLNRDIGELRQQEEKVAEEVREAQSTSFMNSIFTAAGRVAVSIAAPMAGAAAEVAKVLQKSVNKETDILEKTLKEKKGIQEELAAAKTGLAPG